MKIRKKLAKSISYDAKKSGPAHLLNTLLSIIPEIREIRQKQTHPILQPQMQDRPAHTFSSIKKGTYTNL